MRRFHSRYPSMVRFSDLKSCEFYLAGARGETGFPIAKVAMLVESEVEGEHELQFFNARESSAYSGFHGLIWVPPTRFVQAINSTWINVASDTKNLTEEECLKARHFTNVQKEGPLSPEVKLVRQYNKWRVLNV